MGADKTKALAGEAGGGADGGRQEPAPGGPARRALPPRTRTVEAAPVEGGPPGAVAPSVDDACQAQTPWLPAVAPTVDDGRGGQPPATSAPIARTVDDEVLQAAARLPPAPTLGDSARLTPTPTPVARVDVTRLPGEGGTIAGRYQLGRLLGEGTFGRVFEAQHVETTQKVALKVVSLKRYPKEYASHEPRALAAIAHPNVVQLNEYGVEAGAGEPYLWYTMPLYRGHDLSAELASGPLTLRKAHAVFARIAGGLCELHGAGLRHQDVKPDNIYLATVAGTDERHPVLLDLGGAARAGQGRPLVATFPFAAPEQTEALLGQQLGERPAYELTGKVDVYAVGATLLYCLIGSSFYGADIGRRPADADALSSRKGLSRLRDELRAAQRARAAAPLPAHALAEVTGEVRERLANAFRAWLAVDPRARPDAQALLKQLAVLLEWDVELAGRAAAAAERRRAWRQKAFASSVVGGALVTLATGGSVGYARGQQLKEEKESADARWHESKVQHQITFDNLEQCQKNFNKTKADCDTTQRQCQKDVEGGRARYDALVAQCNDQKNELGFLKKRAVEAEKQRCEAALAEAGARCEADRAAAVNAATGLAQARCVQETSSAVEAAKGAAERQCGTEKAAAAAQCSERQAAAVDAAKTEAARAHRASLEGARAECEAAKRVAVAEARRACAPAPAPTATPEPPP